VSLHLVLRCFVKNVMNHPRAAFRKFWSKQGRIQWGRLGRSPPLKPTKVTFSPWFCTIQKTTFAM